MGGQILHRRKNKTGDEAQQLLSTSELPGSVLVVPSLFSDARVSSNGEWESLVVDHFGSSFHIRSTTTTSKLPSCSPEPDPCGLQKFDPAAVLSSGVEEVEGAVPEATFFLNAIQYALRPPLIWTDLEFLRGRDGTSLAVTGAGSAEGPVVGKRSEWSLVFIVVIWGGVGGGGVGGASETERERRILKRMPGPSPSPLATVGWVSSGHRGG